MVVIDVAHILPVVSFVVDMILNKIVFPKRQVIGVLIMVFMSKLASIVVVSITTHSIPGENNLPVAYASYPAYPSNMNLNCVDWSVIVKRNSTPDPVVFQLVNE